MLGYGNLVELSEGSKEFGVYNPDCLIDHFGEKVEFLVQLSCFSENSTRLQTVSRRNEHASVLCVHVRKE